MKPPRRHWPLAAAAAVVAGTNLFLAARWTAVDRRPPPWDAAVHLGTARDYREALGQGRLGGLLLTRPRPGHAAYPPLYHYALIPFLGLERPEAGAVWLNAFWWLLLAAAGAWLAWQLSGPAAAALALLALGLSPAAALSRDPFVDLALAPCVALAYGCLLRSRLYAERRWALWVGAFAGLALLSKWTAWVYLLPCWAAGLRRSTRPNLWRATGLAAALAAPWYLVNMPLNVPRVLESASLGAGEGDPLTLAGGLLFYLRFLAHAFSWPGVALFSAGAGALLWKRRRGGERWLAAWLGVSLLFWSLVSNKDMRYMLPAAAALPALGASALPPAALGAGAALALWNARGLPRPDPAVWPLREILDEAAGLAPGRDRVSVCVLANHINLNTTSLTWLARHWGLERLRLGCRQGAIPEWADAVLIKTPDPGPFLSDPTARSIAESARPGSLFRRVYRERRRWALPDGSSAALFEPRPELRSPSSPLRLERLAAGSTVLEDLRLTPRGGGRFELRARRVRLGKLGAAVEDLRAELEGARLFSAGGTLHPLRVERVRLLSGRLRWSELEQGLSRRLRRPVALRAVPEGVAAETRFGPLRVSLAASAAVEGGALELRLRSLRVGGIPVPGASLVRARVSLEAAPPRRPFALSVAPLRFGETALAVGS